MRDKKLTIRPMAPEDVESVVRIEAECFSMPWTKRAYAEALEDEKYLYLVASLDGKTVGMCGLLHLLGEGNIQNVAVTKEARGRGIASAMLAELMRRGVENGIEDFTLEVRASNSAAIHVYEKLGFVSEGVRPGFYEKPKEDAMIMWQRHRPQDVFYG